MSHRKLAIIAGVSYLIIFLTAIYANFFVLDSLLSNPVDVVTETPIHVRLGVMAFLIAAVFDVFVAWALYELYKDNILSTVSTYFRIIHAAIMGVAVFTLLSVLRLTTAEEIIAQVDIFNSIWLIGLFFFGVHLLLLGRIVKEIKIIPVILILAGVMYILDTGAHFLLSNYESYATVFLILVAVPAILGEMSFTIWLLRKGGK